MAIELWYVQEGTQITKHLQLEAAGSVTLRIPKHCPDGSTEQPELLIHINSDNVTIDNENLDQIAQFGYTELLASHNIAIKRARAHCPSCGLPTVPDHEELTEEAALCDECLKDQEESFLLTCFPGYGERLREITGVLENPKTR